MLHLTSESLCSSSPRLVSARAASELTMSAVSRRSRCQICRKIVARTKETPHPSTAQLKVSSCALTRCRRPIVVVTARVSGALAPEAEPATCRFDTRSSKGKASAAGMCTCNNQHPIGRGSVGRGEAGVARAPPFVVLYWYCSTITSSYPLFQIQSRYIPSNQPSSLSYRPISPDLRELL